MSKCDCEDPVVTIELQLTKIRANEPHRQEHNTLPATTSQVRLTLAMFEKIRESNSAVMQSLHQKIQGTSEELQVIQQKAEAVEAECHQIKAQCLEVNLAIDRAQREVCDPPIAAAHHIQF